MGRGEPPGGPVVLQPGRQLTTVDASLSNKFLIEDFTVMLARTMTSRDFTAMYSYGIGKERDF